MPLTDEEKKFENPENYWEYNGQITIEVTANAPIEIVLPKSMPWDGGPQVTIPNGHVRQGPGGIQFYANPDLRDPFYFRYNHIVCVRKADGSLLWRNHNA